MIQLDDVAVQYRVAQERIPSLKEYAIRRIKGQIRYQNFWALQGICLQVQPGEVFGIIGANGAGKSTLLKVIARVLRPTRGRVRVGGRIAPLLELGAGFDAELTGRENIYLNGTILGYTKVQIDSMFDEIVEFSGLGDFISAPLRTYSTGMYARLGFAVATAQRPEILIVDEILGVGDAEFQARSFERIQSFQAAGATILLVSHSMNRVEEVCSRAMWLDHGEIVSIGSASTVVRQYLEHTREKEAERMIAERAEIQPGGRKTLPRVGSRLIEVTRVRVTDLAGVEKSIFQTSEALVLRMDYTAHQSITAPVFGMAIHRHDGVHVTGPNTAQAGLNLPTLHGQGTVVYTIPRLPLLEGLYHITVGVVNQDDSEVFDYHDQAYAFRVINSSAATRERYGVVQVNGSWELVASETVPPPQGQP
ncbi:MAG: ABC transporter ATP-binding protein [Anaerolineales bacterium]|nr:ABC transporter ATP-binding protein [Anaerolineales bacterium]